MNNHPRYQDEGSGRYDVRRMMGAERPSDLRANHLTAIDAESDVIGAMMVDEAACATAITMLRAEQFASSQHRRAFQAAERLFSGGSPVNAVTIIDVDPDIDSHFVTDTLARLGTASNVEYQALVVRQKWIEREALQTLRRASGEVGSSDILQLIEDTTHSLASLATGDATATHIRYAVEKAMERSHDWRRGETTDLAPSGLYGLDDAVGGFPVSELTTIAAATGAGKTSLLGQCVIGSARRESWREDPRTILVFSAEMTSEQLAARIASNASGVNLRHLRSGSAGEKDFERYEAALIEAGNLPIHIDDTANPTLQRIAARCMHVGAQGKLASVFVDYDEKIDTEGKSEELRVAAIAQGLSAIAKRFEVPVVALSQYSRAATHEMWPSNEWLRYSGKKEHESALILHWVWPRYWVDKDRPEERVVGWDPSRPNLGYIRCTKNRFGPQRSSQYLFEPEYTRFVDLADPETSIMKKIIPPGSSGRTSNPF